MAANEEEEQALSVKSEVTPQVQFREVGGVRIRYVDSGDAHEQVILLSSPWPESIYAFRPIWATLAEHARLPK